MTNLDQILSLLKQKSTLAGIVGLIGSILANRGFIVDAELRSLISEALLVVMSIVAIATQPKDKPLPVEETPDIKPEDSDKVTPINSQ